MDEVAPAVAHVMEEMKDAIAKTSKAGENVGWTWMAFANVDTNKQANKQVTKQTNKHDCRLKQN